MINIDENRVFPYNNLGKLVYSLVGFQEQVDEPVNVTINKLQKITIM